MGEESVKKTPPAPTFSSRLRALRAEAGLSQAALAERAGLTTLGVSQLETGRRRDPSWQTVQALAAALEVSTEAFRTKGD